LELDPLYRAVWIADAHLCSRDCQTARLLSFIRAVRCEYLYLAGDFIDLWQLKRRTYWSQDINNVFRSVLGKTKHGTRVVYVPGNHDEGLRPFAEYHFGNVEIHPRVMHVAADGRRYLVLHGDEFDTIVQFHKWLSVLGSAAYDYLITANRMTNSVRRRLGLPYSSLAARVKSRVKHALMYMDEYEKAACHEARRVGADGVICGHIHHPLIKDHDGVRYANAGDWVENCSALAERLDGSLVLLRWTHEDPEPVATPHVHAPTPNDDLLEVGGDRERFARDLPGDTSLGDTYFA
jgi:UDP-2,3-diacylglucosamine pyrophosphatase LpxH